MVAGSRRSRLLAKAPSHEHACSLLQAAPPLGRPFHHSESPSAMLATSVDI